MLNQMVIRCISAKEEQNAVCVPHSHCVSIVSLESSLNGNSVAAQRPEDNAHRLTMQFSKTPLLRWPCGLAQPSLSTHFQNSSHLLCLMRPLTISACASELPRLRVTPLLGNDKSRATSISNVLLSLSRGLHRDTPMFHVV